MTSGIRPGMMAPSQASTPFAMGAMTQPTMNPGIASVANQQLDPFGAL